MIDPMPLQESAVLFNNSESGTAAQNRDAISIDEPMEESKEVEAADEEEESKDVEAPGEEESKDVEAPGEE